MSAASALRPVWGPVGPQTPSASRPAAGSATARLAPARPATRPAAGAARAARFAGPRAALVSAAAAASTVAASTSTATDPAWEAFSSRAAGEWEGCTATFEPSTSSGAEAAHTPAAAAVVEAGVAVELPAKYVPDAFREWGRTLYDWQTMSSTYFDDAALLHTGLKRLYPIVGCEADAVAYADEPAEPARPAGARLDGAGRDAEGAGAEYAYLPDGSYLVSPPELRGSSARLEACFALPGGGGDAGGAGGAGGEARRVRIVQALARDGAGGAGQVGGSWRQASVEVHMEKYDGPYNGGASLRSCGGSVTAFGEKPPLPAAALAGAWAAAGDADAAVTVGEASTASDAAGAAAGGGSHTLLLPLDAWVTVRWPASGELILEAGVMTAAGARRLAARRVYRAGRLVGARLGAEVAAR